MTHPATEERGPFAQMNATHKLFVCLAAVFVSCLLIGDVIGGKTIPTPLGPISVGVIPFPVTFLLTDVVNDFYGRRGARFLTLLGFAMAVLAWVLLQVGTVLPAHDSTYFTQAEFEKIFGGSAQLFVASMIAYLLGQFLDIQVFQFWKALTQSKHLWLRATGSTLLSQIVDTVVINVIFWGWTAASAPDSFLGKMAFGERWTWVFAKIGREYGIKVVVAILLTPAVYGIHAFVVRVLRIRPEAHEGPGTRGGG
ncbi:MAG: queuosine precursor transporter [Labilithrix sp.]|nr:queuosine precursor transporter [Labilithrix sp.]MBX3219897.1 queuosine precursor transporter [Labilithrix sp.]